MGRRLKRLIPPRERQGPASTTGPAAEQLDSAAEAPSRAAERLLRLGGLGRRIRGPTTLGPSPPVGPSTLTLIQQTQGNLHAADFLAQRRAEAASAGGAPAPSVASREGASLQRQPAAATRPTPRAKVKAPDAAALVATKYPRIRLDAGQLATLQKVFDTRARIEEIAAEMKPLEGSYLSEDVRRREQLQAQIDPLADYLRLNQALFIPTEELLDNDILVSRDEGEKKAKQTAREQGFRESLFKQLVSYKTKLVIGAGLKPDPLFTYYWGPTGWSLGNDGGRIAFKHLMQVEKWNVAYQQILLGRMVELTTDMAELSRQLGAPYGQYGMKVGETWGYVWNTNYKLGAELSNISGHYNDARGRGELFGAMQKAKGSKVVVLAPDNFLHGYLLNPTLNSYDLRNPRKRFLSSEDGNVYFYTKGAEIAGIQQITTADGVDLEAGGNDYGPGWHCRETLTELDQFAIGAILGDAFEDPSAVSSFGQIVIGVIPIVGQIADARDVAIGIHRIWTTGGKDGKLQTAMALLGFIPILGDGIKSAWKAAKGGIKGAGREAAQALAKQAVREGAERTGKEASAELGRQILKDSKEVASALKIGVQEVAAQTKGLQDLAEKAMKGEATAAGKYAKAMGENLDALGGNAGSLVTVAGGDWAKIAKALATSPEGAAVGAKMQTWRVAQFDALEKKVVNKASDFGQDIAGPGAPKMQRTGTPSFASDVDVSFLGPSATAHRNAAIRLMEEEFGPGWRRMLDADIFADPTRMHLFEEPLKKLGGKAAKAAERRIVKESELNVLAKMLKDGADPQTVTKMAKEIGVDMAEVTARQKELTKLSVDYLAGMLKRGTPEDEVKKLAKEMGVDMADVTKHVQSGEDLYRQLELKLDVLHKRFLEAEGDVAKQAKIAEEMAEVQGKLNAAIPGPYMTPGGTAGHVTRREASLRPKGGHVPMSPAIGYTSVLDDLYMLTHALEGTGKGFTEKTAKSMAKYSDRLLVTAGQFGADMSGKTTRPLFDTIEGLLSRARLEKDKPALEKAIQYLSQAKGSLDDQLGTIIHSVKKNADEYLSTVSAAERKGMDVDQWVKKATDALTRERGLIDAVRIAVKDYFREDSKQKE